MAASADSGEVDGGVSWKGHAGQPRIVITPFHCGGTLHLSPEEAERFWDKLERAIHVIFSGDPVRPAAVRGRAAGADCGGGAYTRGHPARLERQERWRWRRRRRQFADGAAAALAQVRGGHAQREQLLYAGEPTGGDRNGPQTAVRNGSGRVSRPGVALGGAAAVGARRAAADVPAGTSRRHRGLAAGARGGTPLPAAGTVRGGIRGGVSGGDSRVLLPDVAAAAGDVGVLGSAVGGQVVPRVRGAHRARLPRRHAHPAGAAGGDRSGAHRRSPGAHSGR
eukprot:ctg_336.g185